jgi:hypothetical protein
MMTVGLRSVLWLLCALCCTGVARGEDAAKLTINERNGLRGVVNDTGDIVVPFRYQSIRHDSDHKRFQVWLDVGDGKTHTGILDERGEVVVPIAYDSLERISNSGDEPTHIARLDDKFGYVDILTGEVLIRPQYDSLYVDPLATDTRGRGFAIARRNNKFGIVTTENVVLAPFEFDAIGDLDANGGGLAETDGKVVWLAIEKGRYLGTRPAPTLYSSNFVPRFSKGSKPGPFDGMYIAADIADMDSAWAAWKDGRLRWAAVPSFQIDARAAYVSFGLFAQARLPLLMNELPVAKQARGFAIQLDDVEAGAALTFTQTPDGMRCRECAQRNLPVLWKAVPAPQPFGGIGVAIRKRPDADAPLEVVDVLADGPAAKAGVHRDDRIVSIDGRDARTLTAESARDALRGPAGSTVRLIVEREGAARPVTIDVKRIVIQLRN